MFLAVVISGADFDLMIHPTEIEKLRDGRLGLIVLVVLRAQANIVRTAGDQDAAATRVRDSHVSHVAQVVDVERGLESEIGARDEMIRLARLKYFRFD